MDEANPTTVACSIRTSVDVRVNASSWENAVACAGELLVATGSCTAGYVTAMVDAVREFGPYMVIAPGIAMPHARPEAGVLAPGLAVITLAGPIEFGHATNDPVDLVIAFAALEKTAHLTTLQRIANLVEDADALSALRTARTDNQARVALSAHQLSKPIDH